MLNLAILLIVGLLGVVVLAVCYILWRRQEKREDIPNGMPIKKHRFA